MTKRVFCRYHLGDCFSALHLLRHLAKLHPAVQFEFYAYECHLKECLPMVEDLPNLNLFDIEKWLPEDAIDGWKQAQDFWSTHPLRNDWVAFTKRYFRRVIRQLGFQDPEPGVLFDFPALAAQDVEVFDLRGDKPWSPKEFDVLFVNSLPCSGQFMDITAEDSLDPMARALAAKHRIITTKPVAGLPCTQEWGMSCADIGRLSNGVSAIIGVSTGPSWFCFNTFNAHLPKVRLLMIGNGEKVCPTSDTMNCPTIATAMAKLKEIGLL